MTARPSTILAWSVCAIALLPLFGALGLAIADEGTTVRVAGVPPHTATLEPAATVLVFGLVGGFAVIGSIVAARAPRNPIGWILCAVSVLIAWAMISELVFWHDAADGVGLAGRLGSWLQNWFWIPVVLLVLVALPLLFPTGRPLTPRWRFAGWLGLAGGAAMAVNSMFRKGDLQDVEWTMRNPLGLHSLPMELSSAGFVAGGVAALLAIASLVVRFRRSRGVERQQLKWFLSAVAIAAVLYVLTPVIGDDDSAVALAFSGLAVTGGIAVAILRYRLYDIDVVINRALVYGTLTIALGASYLGSVLLLQLALAPLTSDSQIAVAASTLAVAALFRPARAQIQRRVDRRFFRRRYDAAQTLAAFGARVRDEVDLEALGAELRTVVADTMQPAHVALWLREAGPS